MKAAFYQSERSVRSNDPSGAPSLSRSLREKWGLARAARFARVLLQANRWRDGLASYSPWPDSRTFLQQSCGIRLGSSQTVNVVLFSLACRKVYSSPKYFVLGHLRPREPDPAERCVSGCGNLVESSVRPARPVFGGNRIDAAERRT